MAPTRVLSRPEVDATWSSLVGAWDISETIWWFPLVETTRRGIAAFEAKPLQAALGPEWLRDILGTRGVERVLYFPEFSDYPVVEMPLEEATFRYDGAEGYWCDARVEGRDWIVYASHEDSVTFGGSWLVQEAQRAWPAWADHLWNGTDDSYRPEAT